jgi:hypothetical protein
MTIELVGWLFVAIALAAFGLIRINPIDIPWHLATARLAEATRRWPTENTFSYTHPDYPLCQQYPVFQKILYSVFEAGGWSALSVLLAVWWVIVVALFSLWGGRGAVDVVGGTPGAPVAPPRVVRLAAFHLPWMFVVFALQPRVPLRPDLLSLTLLAALLLAIDAYRAGRRHAIGFVPLIHWVWVNGHQLFVLSFALQVLFLAHLAACHRERLIRLGADPTDRAVPLLPPLLALAASVGATFLAPLGARTFLVFAHTAGSLSSHRGHVDELRPSWSEPAWAVFLLVALAAGAYALFRDRRRWRLLEAGAWAIGLVLAASAIRGLPYFVLVSAGTLHRSLLRHPATLRLSPFLRAGFRWLSLAMTAGLALALVFHRWVQPPAEIGGVQPGLGRSAGDWPDAAIAAVRSDPPPGRMMNMPWSLANAVIWQWPEQAVFVDPRFESYPRAFLVDAVVSLSNDATLARLLREYRIDWIFAEHCDEGLRARLIALVGGGGWQITYADARTAVLVRVAAATAAYRARHDFSGAQAPGDLVAAPAARRARQRLCYAGLLQALGRKGPARAQVTHALAEAAAAQDAEVDIRARRMAASLAERP